MYPSMGKAETHVRAWMMLSVGSNPAIWIAPGTLKSMAVVARDADCQLRSPSLIPHVRNSASALLPKDRGQQRGAG